MNQHKTQINIINNDLLQISLQSYSTLGPLSTNDLSENTDFLDMPDLESVPIGSDSFVPLDLSDDLDSELTNALDSELTNAFELTNALDSELTNALDSANALDPVFLKKYKEKALEMEKTNKSLDEIKRNIENTVNFNSVSESMEALNNPDILFNRIQNAFDSFKSQTGRTMTYSEMREMMG